MAGDWKTVPLSELYDFSSGLSKPRSEFGFGYGFLTFKDVLDNFFVPDIFTALVNSTEEERRSCSVKRGDVFLTRMSETQEDLGMSCVALKDYDSATFNGFTKRLRPKPSTNIIPEYAAYYFRGPGFRRDVTAMSSLSTRASLNNEMLGRLTFDLPSVEVQATIGRVLKSLDDKIELNRRMNKTLEAMARAIFKSWFIDFDPVRAKMDGRQPVGMDAETAGVFPDGFQESEFGRIPQGWRIACVADVAVVNGWTLTKTDELQSIEYIEISEVMRGEIQAITAYDRGNEPSRARRRLQHGDTVMSTVRPDRGSYFLCLHPSPYLIASTGFAVLSPRSIPWSYLYATMARSDVLDELGRLADGGAYPAIRPEVLANLILVIPANLEVLDAFHAACEHMFQLAHTNRIQSKKLAFLRDTLLPKLLSGEIRVADAEKTIEEVV